MTPSEIALTYLGETEKPKNSGFNDATFEAKMVSVGFVKGHAWCSYFAELVFKEAFPEKLAELTERFSGSTVLTFNNFKDAGYLIGNVPRVNDLVIWRSYKNGKAMDTGHAGVVVSVQDAWQFESVEGNTSDGKSREGYIVARHKRKVLADVQTGLKILGFIQI
jgi:hypothetical protein